jgi:hypothetical protein
MSEPDRLEQIKANLAGGPGKPPWRSWHQDMTALVAEVEQLRGELAEALERAPDPYTAEKADLANWQATDAASPR